MRAMRTASSAVLQPAVFGRMAKRLVSISSRMERLAGSSKSIRRSATVMISAPEASSAARISSRVRYLPVPSMSRLRNSRPAMVNQGVKVSRVDAGDGIMIAFSG